MDNAPRIALCWRPHGKSKRVKQRNERFAVFRRPENAATLGSEAAVPRAQETVRPPHSGGLAGSAPSGGCCERLSIESGPQRCCGRCWPLPDRRAKKRLQSRRHPGRLLKTGAHNALPGLVSRRTECSRHTRGPRPGVGMAGSAPPPGPAHKRASPDQCQPHGCRSSRLAQKTALLGHMTIRTQGTSKTWTRTHANQCVLHCSPPEWPPAPPQLIAFGDQETMASLKERRHVHSTNDQLPTPGSPPPRGSAAAASRVLRILAILGRLPIHGRPPLLNLRQLVDLPTGDACMAARARRANAKCSASMCQAIAHERSAHIMR